MKQKKGGLILKKNTTLDFSYSKVFGKIMKLPEIDFITCEPIKIKDQGDSDMCAAYATCAVVEDHEGVELNPNWFFGQLKKKQGNWKSWGSDLLTVCKVATSVGFIEGNDNYGLEKRDDFAQWKNWPYGLENKAVVHAQKSYFKPDGYGNTFDSFRASIFANLSDKSSIITGVIWRENWTSAENGIIPVGKSEEGYGHAIKIYGQKKINGKLYLICQSSNGNSLGDKGLYYFPEEVINRDFKFGAYLFVDLDPDYAKKKWTFWQNTLWKFHQFYKSLLKLINEFKIKQKNVQTDF